MIAAVHEKIQHRCALPPRSDRRATLRAIALYTMLGFEGLPYRQMILDTPPLD